MSEKTTDILSMKPLSLLLQRWGASQDTPACVQLLSLASVTCQGISKSSDIKGLVQCAAFGDPPYPVVSSPSFYIIMGPLSFSEVLQILGLLRPLPNTLLLVFALPLCRVQGPTFSLAGLEMWTLSTPRQDCTREISVGPQK